MAETKDETKSSSTSSGSGERTAETKKWQLDREHELRFEIEATEKITIKLLKGTAELFGTELGIDREYTFGKSKFAIFTWHGAELLVLGKCRVCYPATDTPMISYINLHAALEKYRKTAREKNAAGPVAMIVGPVDSGKSTLARILLSYAVRAGWKPTFVDLDVGQNAITIPACVAATAVEHPASVESAEMLQAKNPLVYYFGHTSPSGGQTLYERLVDKLSTWVAKRCATLDTARSAGVLINTCGWVEGPGYANIVHAANTFKVDVILVVGHERLYSDLKSDASLNKTSIAKLAKSGGVVTRDSEYRRGLRNQHIREYFYGPANDLCPHTKIVNFRDVSIYRVGTGPQAPSSALPIGTKRLLDPNKVTRVIPSADLLHSILAVSFAREEKGLLDENTAGFVYVTAVDTKGLTMTILAPTPGPLPQVFLLAGQLKWYDG